MYTGMALRKGMLLKSFPCSDYHSKLQRTELLSNGLIGSFGFSSSKVNLKLHPVPVIAAARMMLLPFKNHPFLHFGQAGVSYSVFLGSKISPNVR